MCSASKPADYFQQIVYANPLHMGKDVSESSLFVKFTEPTLKAFLKPVVRMCLVTSNNLSLVLEDAQTPQFFP